jgi:hypothetical protein
MGHNFIAPKTLRFTGRDQINSGGLKVALYLHMYSYTEVTTEVVVVCV